MLFMRPVIVLLLVILPGSVVLADELAPLLWKKVAVPEPFVRSLTNRAGETVRFGGDIRLGDLNNDGAADLLVYRSADGGMKPTFLGAFDLDGAVLWKFGETNRGEQPNRPGPVAIHDIDADGETEVIALMVDGDERRHWQSLENVVLRIFDGASGEIEREARPQVVRRHGKPGPPRKKTTSWNDPNWVHQRILIANFRGLESPRDFVIKLGRKLFAFDETLALLWTYDIPASWQKYGSHTAYIPAVGDLDGDGRDEVTGGYYLVGPDGEVIWEQKLGPHMDSVAVVPWDGGQVRVIASGHGCVLDRDGKTLLRLGQKRVPHGQEVRVADFDHGSPGPEMLIRYDGHQTGVRLIANDGSELRRFDLNESPNNTGMEAVWFHGRDRPALITNGGALLSGNGEALGQLPGLPDPILPVAKQERPGWRMPWYHAIPANLCGDEKEEIVIYNPWDSAVYLFTAGVIDETAFEGYRPGPRQVNPRLMD